MAKKQAIPSFEGDAPAASGAGVLLDRRELALVAVERTRMPMVVSDPRQPDNPIVLANQAFLESTGYSADEVIGRNCRFLQGPATDKNQIAAVRRAVARGDDHFDIELLNYRKDGSTFWNQLSLSAVRDGDGKLIYFFGSQKDVTARRRAQELEATERLLLMEVDHRSLNALALVKSIVHLSRAETIEEFSAAVRGRVDVLARAHQLLARSGWSGAELDEILDADGSPPQLRAQGEKLVIPPRLVQPLALVLHELLSNAKQHGALQAERGQVSVRWHRDEGALILDWVEEGAKPSPPPTHRFGLNIVTGVVERQLGGCCCLRWPPGGLQAMLKVPLEGQVTIAA